MYTTLRSAWPHNKANSFLGPCVDKLSVGLVKFECKRGPLPLWASSPGQAAQALELTLQQPSSGLLIGDGRVGRLGGGGFEGLFRREMLRAQSEESCVACRGFGPSTVQACLWDAGRRERVVKFLSQGDLSFSRGGQCNGWCRQSLMLSGSRVRRRSDKQSIV